MHVSKNLFDFLRAFYSDHKNWPTCIWIDQNMHHPTKPSSTIPTDRGRPLQQSRRASRDAGQTLRAGDGLVVDVPPVDITADPAEPPVTPAL